MRTVLVAPPSASSLPTLIVAPESESEDSPALLFLHGMREAGSTLNEVPKVCMHQSPPWQAMVGRIPDASVIAPQAPPLPAEDTWSWRDHVHSVGQCIRDMFSGRRLLATGFSRGGLGVLQILAAYPDLFERWSIIDPQPPRDSEEMKTILAAVSKRPGWVRYGVYRNRSAAWMQFADALDAIVPEPQRDVTSLGHGDMALAAYSGDRLASTPKQNLYEFLNIRF